MSALELLLLVAAGIFAGVVNTLAGGGSLVTVPLLVWTGMPANVANATNRVGVLLQSVSAWSVFRRHPELHARLERLEVVPAVVGGVIGALLGAFLDPHAFDRIVGWLMLLLLGTLFVRPERWGQGDGRPGPAWARVVGFFGMGLYGGFLQAGVGLFLIAGFVRLSGRDLRGANAGKVGLVALFTAPAVVVFAATGLVRWVPALAVATGSLIGGRLGARWTLSWGVDAVRGVIVVVVVATSGRLLGWW